MPLYLFIRLGEQDGLVVKMLVYGSEGPTFDPQKYHFVQLS